MPRSGCSALHRVKSILKKRKNTHYSLFEIVSSLFFHLNPVGFTTNMLTNIPDLCMSSLTTRELLKLPLSFISKENDVIRKNWVLSEDEGAFLATIKSYRGEPRYFRTRNC